MNESLRPSDPERGALPEWALGLLQRVVPHDHRDIILGDFAEVYRSVAAREGHAAAVRWYWVQVVKSLPAFLGNGLYFGGAMFRNYVKIAVRSLVRRKFYTALNVGGLAVGLAACLLIFQYVTFERSYDTFHANGDDVYRVTFASTIDGRAGPSAAFTEYGLEEVLRETVPEVQEVARVHPSYSLATIAYTDAGGQRHAVREEGLLYVDPSFLTMFSFPLRRGNPATALKEPRTLVLSEAAARRYFGEADPIGQTIDVRAWGDGAYTVTGVLAEVPAPSHLDVDLLLPLQDILEDEDGQYHDTDGWNWTNFITYVQLRPGTDPVRVAPKVADIMHEQMRDEMQAARLERTVTLQPLKAIHLYSAFEEDWGTLGHYKTVYFFTLVALFILIIAWVNYINLSTARAVERAKEIGVRKVSGARKSQVMMQFLCESALVNGLALAAAIGLAVVGLPVLNDLAGTSITPLIWKDAGFWGGFLSVFVLGVLLSSVYPALILSAFKPVTVLKGRAGTAASRHTLRRLLVVFQFVASIALLIGTYAAYRQVTHMRGVDLGIDIEQMLILRRPSIVDEAVNFSEARDVLLAELAALPAVEEVTTSASVPGNGFNLGTTARREGSDPSDRENVHVTWINYNFLDTYGFRFAAGRNFSEERSTDQEEGVIINETAVRAFGFASNEEALEERVFLGGGDNTFAIVGILEDFNWMSVKQDVEPVLFLPTRGGGYYSMKVQTANLDETLGAVRRIYDEVFPGNPFDAFFADRFFDAQYQADQQFGTLFGLFALFAVLVACLGLVGLAAFTAAQRTKEIGVRKVLGATSRSIVGLLLVDFGKLVLLALVVTLPLAYWALTTWLSGFAARIDLSPGLFLLPGLTVLLVALLTVSYHTLRAALANPADSLRYE